VKTVGVAFAVSLGIDRSQKLAPLVVGTTMLVNSSCPNILSALDLTRPGALTTRSCSQKSQSSAEGLDSRIGSRRSPAMAVSFAIIVIVLQGAAGIVFDGCER
jgi:hypothetical protein